MHPALKLVLYDIFQHLRDIPGLIADPFHIRDHFQCRGYHPQVTGYRLLLQQDLHAERFDLPLLVIDLVIQIQRMGQIGQITVQQALGYNGNRFLAQCSHPDQFHIQLLQLTVKSCTHINQTFL